MHALNRLRDDYPQNLAALVAYSSVSVLAASIDLCILHILVSRGVAQSVAVSAAFLTATATQYALYRYVLFKTAHKSILIEGWAYAIAVCISWWSTVGLVAAFSHAFGMSTLLAKVLTIPIIFPLGYLSNRFIIFRR